MFPFFDRFLQLFTRRSAAEDNREPDREDPFFDREAYKAHAERSGVDPYDYETEEEFSRALLEVWRNRSRDPLSDADPTVYTSCGVVFRKDGYLYWYRSTDTSIRVGEHVIVTVGTEEQEQIAEVVFVEQHTRKTAPYPVDQTKLIQGKVC